MVVLILVWAAGTPATGSGTVALSRQRAVAYLTEPTLIGSTIVQGPVLFTHDETKMARGEPCTTVYLIEPPAKEPVEAIASFHCIPTRRVVVHKFTITTQPAALGFGCVLTEYQFAGDAEAHGVPIPALANVRTTGVGGT
jgi:hypothetical protein